VKECAQAGLCAARRWVTLALLLAALGPAQSWLATASASDILLPSGLYGERSLKQASDPRPEIFLDADAMLASSGERREKSPALAAALSAVVPGAGHLYAGSKRGLVYMAVEVAALIAHFSYKSDGNRKEDQFRDFADAQWDTLRYREGSGVEGCFWSEESDSTIVDLMRNNRSRFYEQIAREEFRCGWRESWQRDEYRHLRQVSDDLLGKANTAMTVIFLNHIISAVDAFRLTRSMRMTVAPETELRMDVEGGYRNPRAVLRLVRHL
jgi:hypothetical protein